MSQATRILLSLVLGLVGAGSLFTVGQTQQALVLRFGDHLDLAGLIGR
mgnify:CR=1 FL=1